MKGGQTPIHFMKWAASDFVNDPWVRLAARRNDVGALAVYSLFLNVSFMEGGYLPADPELLAASIGLPPDTVREALAYWSAPACGKIQIADGRAWNPRVVRDIACELKYRRAQQRIGKRGGRPPGSSGASNGSGGSSGRRVDEGKHKGRVFGNLTPPAPSPAPLPAPAPIPPPAPLREPSGGEPPPTPATEAEARALATRVLGPQDRSESPANPLVDRDALVREGHEAITFIAGHPEVNLDPTEVVLKASEWNGRGYARLDTMRDDRLAHTVNALRRWKRKLRGEDEPAVPQALVAHGGRESVGDKTVGAMQRFIQRGGGK